MHAPLTTRNAVPITPLRLAQYWGFQALPAIGDASVNYLHASPTPANVIFSEN